MGAPTPEEIDALLYELEATKDELAYAYKVIDRMAAISEVQQQCIEALTEKIIRMNDAG
mgnify:CR=1 FL=1